MIKNRHKFTGHAAGKKTFLSSILILPLALVVVLAIHASHKGAQLSELEKQASALKEENKFLEMQIIKSTSLISLAQNSEKFGFDDPSKVVYLDNPRPVVSLR